MTRRMTKRFVPAAPRTSGGCSPPASSTGKVPAHRPVLVHRQDHLPDLGSEVRGLQDQALLAPGGSHLLVGQRRRDPFDLDLDELSLGHVGLAQRIDKGIGGVLDPGRPGPAGDAAHGRWHFL